MGAELWVVFEGSDGERLSPWILTHQTDPVVRSQYLLFDQLPLTDREKRGLVQVLGKDDDAAEFTTVKAVCSDKAAKQQLFQDLFQSWRRQTRGQANFVWQPGVPLSPFAYLYSGQPVSVARIPILGPVRKQKRFAGLDPETPPDGDPPGCRRVAQPLHGDA